MLDGLVAFYYGYLHIGRGIHIEACISKTVYVSMEVHADIYDLLTFRCRYLWEYPYETERLVHQIILLHEILENMQIH